MLADVGEKENLQLLLAALAFNNFPAKHLVLLNVPEFAGINGFQ